ncbi:hypothetical protein ACIP1X_24745 [Pseudomonas sp. NPDC088885]|uniref:hypothetical protein n=1 Tax=Pseudomonas sp. NPDC088885 TaxID=3364457 RepID=UPI00381D9C92
MYDQHSLFERLKVEKARIAAGFTFAKGGTDGFKLKAALFPIVMARGYSLVDPVILLVSDGDRFSYCFHDRVPLEMFDVVEPIILFAAIT